MSSLSCSVEELDRRESAVDRLSLDLISHLVLRSLAVIEGHWQFLAHIRGATRVEFVDKAWHTIPDKPLSSSHWNTRALHLSFLDYVSPFPLIALAQRSISLQVIAEQFFVLATSFGDDEHMLTVPQSPSWQIRPFRSPSWFLFHLEYWPDWWMLCAGESGST